MIRYTIPFITGIFIAYLLTGCNQTHTETQAHQLPNIIYILADDLGYGDLSCLNENSKTAGDPVQTAHLDALAAEGMVFTDAHSNSAVCSPTRYGILTGRYAWRTRLKNGVLWSYDEHLIDPERMTVASLLKKSNYHTACIGKWHLGLDWAKDATGQPDITQPIQNGPLANGFDTFYGITASLDIPPYVYIENDRITNTEIDTIEANTGKGFWRKGPISQDFKHIEVLPHLTEKAIDFIHTQAEEENPFFLYFALPAPHTPILPTVAFLEKSGTNAYGDFVLMVDDVVAQVMQALHVNNLEENTLVIFTSDNGCSPMADFEELARYGHHPSYHFRGNKADIYEGGHRIPFIVHWPAKVRPGSKSDQTICLTDLLATVAGLTGQQLPDNAGEDSYNLLPLLLGEDNGEPVREATVHHSINGSFSIRQGNWKLAFCPGSGGWSHPTPEEAQEQDLPPIQLFDVAEDVAEQNNVANAHPDIVNQLTALMQQYIQEGRSTPGTPQQNEGETPLMVEVNNSSELP